MVFNDQLALQKILDGRAPALLATDAAVLGTSALYRRLGGVMREALGGTVIGIMAVALLVCFAPEAH